MNAELLMETATVEEADGIGISGLEMVGAALIREHRRAVHKDAQEHAPIDFFSEPGLLRYVERLVKT